MNAAKRARLAALDADVTTAHQRLDEVLDAMPGLHGDALSKKTRAAVALVNETADLNTKIRMLGDRR